MQKCPVAFITLQICVINGRLSVNLVDKAVLTVKLRAGIVLYCFYNIYMLCWIWLRYAVPFLLWVMQTGSNMSPWRRWVGFDSCIPFLKDKGIRRFYSPTFKSVFFSLFTSEKSCLEGLIVVSSATKSFWMFNKFEQKTLRKHAFAYVVIWSCADKWQRNNCFWIIFTMRWSTDKVAGCEYFMLH